MNKDEKKIRFNISSTSCMELMSHRKLQNIDLDECFTGNLICGSDKFFILNERSISSQALRLLDEAIDRGLKGLLELHESICDDIGQMWNQDLDAVGKRVKFEKIVEEPVAEGYTQWIGLRYYLWSNPYDKLAFWFYCKEGRFFFELTPVYPWALCEPEPDEIVIPFEEFMKNYKPILILEIPRERLIEWRRQTTRLMRLIMSNERRRQPRWLALRRHYRLLRIKRLMLTRHRQKS